VLIAESEYCERAAAIAGELPNIRHMFALRRSQGIASGRICRVFITLSSRSSPVRCERRTATDLRSSKEHLLL